MRRSPCQLHEVAYHGLTQRSRHEADPTTDSERTSPAERRPALPFAAASLGLFALVVALCQLGAGASLLLSLACACLVLHAATFLPLGPDLCGDLPLWRAFRARRGAGPERAPIALADFPPDRLWVVIDGWVHDLTGFRHPGGEVLDHFAGRDCTAWFLAVHPKHERALRALEARAVGPLADKDARALLSPVDRRWRALFDRALARGWFRFPARVLLRELTEALGLMVLGLWIMDQGAAVAGFLVLTFGSARWGFHYHDAAHGAVHERAETARRDARIGGILLWGVDFYTGGAEEHFLHHGFPNVREVDHAIDMQPFLRWHPSQRALFPLSTGEAGPGRGAGWYGLIIWLVYPLYALNGFLQARRRREHGIAALVLARHAAWPLLGPFLWPVLLSAFAGMAWFAVIASCQHFAMPVSEHVDNPLARDGAGRLSFVRSQAPRILDAHSHPVSDWLLGHFTLHTAHHLYPVIPRRNLARLQPEIEAMLEADGRPLHRTGFLASLRGFHRILRDPLRADHFVESAAGAAQEAKRPA